MPTVANDCLLMLNNLNAPLSLLFLGFSILPLFFVTWEREGLLIALLKPIRQVGKLSLLFFVLQGRCIGHYFARELSLAKAAYLATGRGLAIEHVPFHKLYAFLSGSCYLPGAELMALLAGVWALSTPTHRVTITASVFAALTPLALLLGPALLNPHCLRLNDWASDLAQWGLWLMRGHFAKADANANRSWSEFHVSRVNDKLWEPGGKRSCGLWAPRAKFIWMPSKELLLALPQLVLAYHTLFAPASSAANRTFFALIFANHAVPLLPLACALALTVAVHLGRLLVSPCRPPGSPALAPAVSSTIFASNDVRLHLFLAAVFASATAAEAVLIHFCLPDLTAAAWLGLCSTRYFGWRVACNVLAYASMMPIGESERQKGVPSLFVLALPPRKPSDAGAALHAMHSALRLLRIATALTHSSLALLVDGLLGLLLLLAMLVLVLPCEALKLITRGWVSLDDLWYRWLVTNKGVPKTSEEVKHELGQVGVALHRSASLSPEPPPLPRDRAPAPPGPADGRASSEPRRLADQDI